MANEKPSLLRRIVGASSAPASPAAHNTRRSITASAVRLSLNDRVTMQEVANQTVRNAWQETSWDHYDRIGEIKYAYGLVASIFSRLRIYPAVVLDPNSPPVKLTDGVTIERPASEKDDVSASQKSNDGLTPQQGLDLRKVYEDAFLGSSVPTMLRSFALNMNVPGECYMIHYRNQWRIKSTTELKVMADGTPHLQRSQASLPVPLDRSTPVGRVWREHPRYSFEPDSAMRAMADECDELLLLSRVIRSNSRARLNAGLLYVADEVTVAAQTDTDDQDIEEDEEMALEEYIYQILTGPVTNEDNPNTVVPGILRGPSGDIGNMISHIKFESKTDEFLVDRAEKVLDRILNSLEVPKDSVTGYSGVKFANSVHVDESMYKAHIEPLALIFCDAVVDIIIHPALKDLGWKDGDLAKATVWYDPSEIVTRPDRATDAQALYDKKELSGDALREAFGFSDGDRPTEEELANRLAMGSVIPPEILSILLSKLLPTILGKNLAASQNDGLPSSLTDALDGTDTPGSPNPDELGSSVPDSIEAVGGTPVGSDSTAPADQFGQSTIAPSS